MASGPEHPEPAPMAVRRRRVFFVCGFDPQGPGHYHRLYADQARLQAAVGNYRIDIGARTNVEEDAASWPVRWCGGHADAPSVETTFEFLRWDDIVRDHWPRHRWHVLLGTLASTARQVRNGVLWRILKTSWPAFLVLTMPPALVLGMGAWWALTLLAAGAAWRWRAGWPAGAAVAGIVLCVAASAWGFRKIVAWAEAKVQMAWLMRSTRFILAQARGAVPTLERRLDRHAHRIAEAWRDPAWDEVLVVGHSSGAMLAVSAVARALSLSEGSSTLAARPLSLLTLGECIPMLSYQPEAEMFRSELSALARSKMLEWIDFTAPPDGCCFALVDPTAVCGRATAGTAWRAPKLLSPQFARLFPADAYARIRKDKYRCHFQYLMASELPGTYDFFAITAGPLSLDARFGSQRSVEGFHEFQMFGGDR